MAVPEDVRAHLTDDEAVIDVGPGSVADGAGRLDGSIAVTDRRLLFLSGDHGSDRTIDIAQGAICSFESRTRTRATSRGTRVRAVLGLGAVLAAASVLAVVLVASSALEVVLAGLAAAGAVSAGYVRRSGLDVDSSPLNTLARAIRNRGPGHQALGQYERRVPSSDRDLGAVALAGGAGLALVGLVAVTPGSILPVLVALFLGGVALVDGARRRHAALEERDQTHRRERAVTLDLASGRSVHLTVPAGRRLDHELSVLLHATAREPPDEPRPRSRQPVG